MFLITLGTLDLAQAFQSLGIMLNDNEILTLFNYIDTDNSGDCSMQEMLAGCLPKHFTSKPWWEKSRERQNIIDNIKKEHERAMHRENICTHPTLTTSALMKEIRVKVEQTASKGSDQIRQMLIRFKKPSGTSKAYKGPANRQVSVDIARFYNQVKLLGITMTEEQTKNVFQKLDVDKSGEIDIFEFLSGMSNDYSGKTNVHQNALNCIELY